MSHYNWVDYIVLAICFFSIIAGFIRGLVREVISIISLIAAFMIASSFSGQLADILMKSTVAQGMITSLSNAIGANASSAIGLLTLAVSFLILFVLVSIVGAIINYFFSGMFRLPGIGFINAILGGGFGFIRGYIICVVLMFIVQLTPVAAGDVWKDSHYVQSFQGAVDYVARFVQPTIDRVKERLGGTLQSFNSEFQRDRNFYQLNNS
jgi:membrane protein required for colicin V production